MTRQAGSSAAWNGSDGQRRGLEAAARLALARVSGRIALYGRYALAGRAIAHLSGLSDAQLKARGLRRETLGRDILARFGLGRDA